MNTEIFAFGMMMEFGGVGLLIVAGLFIAALDLVRAIFVPSAKRSAVAPSRCLSQKSSLRSTPSCERPKFNQ
jgi:hypothetical protein